MPQTIRPLSQSARIAKMLLIAGAGVLSVSMPGVARAEQPSALVRVAEPDGFSRLTGPQVAVVDVYFGAIRVGTADVRHRPGELTFVAPDKLLGRLPDVENTPALRTALAGSLPTNSHLLCAETSTAAGCGRLEPDLVGVIFDRDRFRVDLFFAQSLLRVRPATERIYLQAPANDLSLLASLDAVVAGSNLGDPLYNVQTGLLIGRGEARLRANLELASGFGLQSDRLTLELDRPGWRYSAGSFWAPGTAALSRRKVLGFGIETQLDTRLDKDIAGGTPLVAFLTQRARVEILIEGRVIASRIYDAGNQTLDTSGLPDGTYEILLRIDELGGGRREEVRLFTRNPRIPTAGQDVRFAYAGVMVDDRTPEFLDVTSHPVVQVGGARRFNSAIALDATLMATDRAAVGELGGYLITKPGLLRVALIAQSLGQYGGILQLSSNGTSPFHFHFDLRRIVVDTDAAQVANADLMDPSYLSLGRTSHTLASGVLSYSLPNAQISVAASLRDEDGVGRTYSIGPAVRWNFLRKGDWRLYVNGDAAVTDRGTSGYVGFSIQFNRGNLGFGARGGARMSDVAGDRTGGGLVGAIDGAIQKQALGGTLDLGAGYEHEVDRDVLTGTANLRSQAGSIHADVLQTFGGHNSQMQYSLGIHTTLVGAGKELALEGRQRSESMVLVSVDGARAQDRFEVLVNEGRVGSVGGDGGSVVIPVPAYREYDIRIRPESVGLLQYDSSVRRVSVYPGSVAALRWQARSVMPVFGRIHLPNAGAIAGAMIMTDRGPVEVDDLGYFQIEAESGGQLDVRLADGGSCEIELPQSALGSAYVSVGDVMCDHGVRLGSVQLSEAQQ